MQNVSTFTFVEFDVSSFTSTLASILIALARFCVRLFSFIVLDDRVPIVKDDLAVFDARYHRRTFDQLGTNKTAMTTPRISSGIMKDNRKTGIIYVCDKK
ncbi:hypothetical protein ACOME3_006358 [Neoechinorhynchus agilis]